MDAQLLPANDGTDRPRAYAPALHRPGRWRGVLLAGAGLLMLALVACSGSDAEDDAATMADGAAGEGGVTAPMEQPGPAMTGADGDFMAQTSSREESGGGANAVAPSPGGSSSGAGDGSPQPIADVLGRQVIRNGSMELTVESVPGAFDQVRGVVEQAEGYVAGSSIAGRDESQYARLTLRIPAERFDQVVADLRNLAIEVDSVSTSSQDVTEEYTDLEASLRNLRAVEEQYLTLLGETQEIGEILQVQDRLNSVRYEIERVQGRLNLLENQTSLATLEVSLYPEASSLMEAEPDSGFAAEVREAWDSSLEFVGDLGTGLVVALVWSWWLIPVVVIAAVLLRRFAGRLRTGGPVNNERVDTPEGAA